MNREIVLDYIETALHQQIKTQVKYDIEEECDIDHIKDGIEYHDKVMKYVEENLR